MSEKDPGWKDLKIKTAEKNALRIKGLPVGRKQSKLPVIQGGMGVGISLSGLAGGDSRGFCTVGGHHPDRGSQGCMGGSEGIPGPGGQGRTGRGGTLDAYGNAAVRQITNQARGHPCPPVDDIFKYGGVKNGFRIKQRARNGENSV